MTTLLGSSTKTFSWKNLICRPAGHFFLVSLEQRLYHERYRAKIVPKNFYLGKKILKTVSKPALVLNELVGGRKFMKFYRIAY